MGFKTLDEILAYQAARAFKVEVYRLVSSSPRAQQDLRYRTQLLDSAASVEVNIAEGFGRYFAREFVYYLRIARGSLAEALAWIRDGVDRGHFTADAVARALELGQEARRLVTGLITSLQPFLGGRTPTPKNQS